jgi:hypothetical protein
LKCYTGSGLKLVITRILQKEPFIVPTSGNYEEREERKGYKSNNLHFVQIILLYP